MKYLKILLYTASFVLFFLAVVFGQKNIGYSGLIFITVGITGLLLLLFVYNRNYQ